MGGSVLVDSVVVRDASFPNFVTLTQQKLPEGAFPCNSRHLEDTQLYPLCGQAFVASYEGKNPSVYLVFNQCWGPETQEIRKALGNTPYKGWREDNHATLKIELEGEENIREGLKAIFSASMAFASQLKDKQQPRPLVNEVLQKAMKLELYDALAPK